MLTQITLERFKCFNRLYMPLKPLTLIAGTNGAGKSSIIQALLLLRQSCKDKDYDWKQSVVINGGLTDLDDAGTLLYINAEGDHNDIVLSLETMIRTKLPSASPPDRKRLQPVALRKATWTRQKRMAFIFRRFRLSLCRQGTAPQQIYHDQRDKTRQPFGKPFGQQCRFPHGFRSEQQQIHPYPTAQTP